MTDIREVPITAHLPVTHTPHTSLPWHVGASFGFEADKLRAVRDAGGEIVADALFARDAAYVVHACNLYPELIAALREVVSRCADIADVIDADPVYPAAKFLRTTAERYRAVLAKAEGVTHGS